MAWFIVAVAISLCVPAAWQNDTPRGRNIGLLIIGLASVLILIAACLGGK